MRLLPILAILSLVTINPQEVIMSKQEIWEVLLILGLAGLGLTFLVIAACTGFDPLRGLAGCALVCSSRYMS